MALISPLIFAPIAFHLLQLIWVLNFNTKKKCVFNFLHQNTRLAELISGTVESPLQFVLMLVLNSKGKVPLLLSASPHQVQHKKRSTKATSDIGKSRRVLAGEIAL